MDDQNTLMIGGLVIPLILLTIKEAFSWMKDKNLQTTDNKIHKIKQRIKNIKLEQGKSLSPQNHIMLEIEKINLEFDLFTIKSQLGAKYVKQNIFNR